MLSPAKTTEELKTSLKARGLEVVPHKQMKNFVALKEKIVRTDELIKMYRLRAQECERFKQQARDSLAQLSSMEQAVKGLKSELQVMYEENGSLKEALQSAYSESDEARQCKLVQELLCQQLSAQVEQLQSDNEGSSVDLEQIKKERNSFRDEKEKWIKKHQKLQKELLQQSICCTCSAVKRRRRRRTSELSSMCDIASPPFIPLAESTKSHISHHSLESLLTVKLDNGGGDSGRIGDLKPGVMMDAGCKIERILSGSIEDGSSVAIPVSTPGGSMEIKTVDDLTVKDEPTSPNFPSILTPPHSSTFRPVPTSSFPSHYGSDLKNDLFGEDSDLDNDLRVSDTDSSCSESSLDDLADLLTGPETGPETNSVKPEKMGEISRQAMSVDMPILALDPRSSDLDDYPLVSEQKCQRKPMQELSENASASEAIALQETAPRIQVEHETSSSSDSEMELSDLEFEDFFSFGSNFLSPLPPSPVRTCTGTAHLPISPLPPSPCHNLQPPLPLSPCHNLLSPLPPSPPHNVQPLLSPLPPSPPHNVQPSLTLHTPSSSDVRPMSPFSISSVIDHQDALNIPISPLPPSPINAHHPGEARTPIDAHQEAIPINAHREIVPITDAPLSPVRMASTNAPIMFAADIPKGLRSPIPCTVEMHSQSPTQAKIDFNSSSKTELKVSQRSLFSSPPLPKKCAPMVSSPLLLTHMRRLSEKTCSATAPPAAKRRHISASAYFPDSSQPTVREFQKTEWVKIAADLEGAGKADKCGETENEQFVVPDQTLRKSQTTELDRGKAITECTFEEKVEAEKEQETRSLEESVVVLEASDCGKLDTGESVCTGDLLSSASELLSNASPVGLNMDSELQTTLRENIISTSKPVTTTNPELQTTLRESSISTSESISLVDGDFELQTVLKRNDGEISVEHALSVPSAPKPVTGSCVEEGEITDDDADCQMDEVANDVFIDADSTQLPSHSLTSFDKLLKSYSSPPLASKNGQPSSKCGKKQKKRKPTQKQCNNGSIPKPGQLLSTISSFPTKEVEDPQRVALPSQVSAIPLIGLRTCEDPVVHVANTFTATRKRQKIDDADSSLKPLLQSQVCLLAPKQSSSLQHILEVATPPVKKPKVEQSDSLYSTPPSPPPLTIVVDHTPLPPSPQATSVCTLPGYSLRSRKVHKYENKPRKRRSSATTEKSSNVTNVVASLKIPPQSTASNLDPAAIKPVKAKPSCSTTEMPVDTATIPNVDIDNSESNCTDTSVGMSVKSESICSGPTRAAGVTVGSSAASSSSSTGDGVEVVRTDIATGDGVEGVQVVRTNMVTGDGVRVVRTDIVTGDGVRVVRTDVATGQEEDQTPASSPKGDGMAGTTTTTTPSTSLAPSKDSMEIIKEPYKNTRKSDPVRNGPLSSSSISDLQMPLNSAASQQTTHPKQTTPVVAGISLPPAQQQLTQAMQCPLPLPPWLINSMGNVQLMLEHCTASCYKGKCKKRFNPMGPILRNSSQNPYNYVRVNLSRMVCGHLSLSPVISMFADPRGCPSPDEFIKAVMQFLMEAYCPKIEHVLALYHQQCDAIRDARKTLHFSPLDPAFPPPLLRPECQMIALFAHLCRMNPKMPNLVPDLTSALHQALLRPNVQFHTLAALGRIFSALCRLQGDGDRVLFLCFDLLHKPLPPNEFPVLSGIASVWPHPLSRKVVNGNKLIEKNKLQIQVLEQQSLSYTLETVVMALSNRNGVNESMARHMYTLCMWTKHDDVKALTECLVELLKKSRQVYIDSTPAHQFPWRRPRPSVNAFHIVHCLRQLSWLQGWVWTNDTLIGAHLWPLLQKWNGNPASIREATVVCAVRLIGFVSQQGVSHDPSSAPSSSISQLQRVLCALLRQSSGAIQASFPIQLAAVDSLLELCPPSHPKAQEVVGVVNTWLQACQSAPSGTVLSKEFAVRLQPYGRTATVK